MRTLLVTAILLLSASLVQAQTTLNVFPVGSSSPVATFAVTPTCNQPTLTETITRTSRPNMAAWPDAAAPGRDCLASLVTTPVALLPALAPNGYQMTLTIGSSARGPLSNAFLAPPAQVTPTITAGQPFRAQAPHSCQNATAYRLYVDDVKVGADLLPSACVSGTVTASSSGVSPGTHTAEIRSVDAVGEFPGGPVTFQANQARTTPAGTTTVVQP